VSGDGEASPDNLEGYLADIRAALEQIGHSLGALAQVARFSVMAETGTDPLEGTIYQNHGFASREEGEG
jgi:hypothetical protein